LSHNPEGEVGSSIVSLCVLCFFSFLVHTAVPARVPCLCPVSVGVVATFVDPVVFPEQCSALPVCP